MDIVSSLLIMVVASMIIMFVCNSLEQSLDYLGRNMSGGAKGALLMAIASSLPEIMVSFAFLFSGKPELIMAGVFVTAGSALLNTLVIPALSIIFARDSEGNKVDSFTLNRKLLARDVFWLLSTEAVFIYFIGMNVFTITMSLILIGMYVLYAANVIFDSKRCKEKPEEFEYEELDHTEMPKSISWIGSLLDFNKNLFDNKEFTTKTALAVAGLSCAVVGVACHFLASSTESVSVAIGIPVALGAAVFAAAATSVPDALLSIGAARSGEGDDAVANAFGSNIFDTSFAIGFPLLIAMSPLGALLFGFNLEHGLVMKHDAGDMMDHIRYFVFATSALAALGVLAQATKITKKTAYYLLSLYALWIGFVVYLIS